MIARAAPHIFMTYAFATATVCDGTFRSSTASGFDPSRPASVRQKSRGSGGELAHPINEDYFVLSIIYYLCVHALALDPNISRPALSALSLVGLTLRHRESAFRDTIATCVSESECSFYSREIFGRVLSLSSVTGGAAHPAGRYN